MNIETSAPPLDTANDAEDAHRRKFSRELELRIKAVEEECQERAPEFGEPAKSL